MLFSLFIVWSPWNCIAIESFCIKLSVKLLSRYSNLSIMNSFLISYKLCVFDSFFVRCDKQEISIPIRKPPTHLFFSLVKFDDNYGQIEIVHSNMYARFFLAFCLRAQTLTNFRYGIRLLNGNSIHYSFFCFNSSNIECGCKWKPPRILIVSAWATYRLATNSRGMNMKMENEIDKQ